MGAGTTIARPAAPTAAQERAFVQSVLYAALFDYPLTPAQLCDTLIGQRATEAMLLQWYDASEYLRAMVGFEEGFFFPRGRRDLIDVRRGRETTSRTLLADFSGPLALVRWMPFVRMAALSGSLAHLNAEREADLDLFVLTRAHRVWCVTVTILLVARLLGWRKRLCLNYVVSERDMWIAPADLFSANQIVHLQPITGEAAYRRFLAANQFVERFYPNFTPRPLAVPPDGATAPRRTAGREAVLRAIELLLDWSVAPLLERCCRALYRAHLRRQAPSWKSRDQVRLDAECLKLHTSSHRREVMERFERAIEDVLTYADERPSASAAPL